MNYTKRFYVDDLPDQFHEEPFNPRWCYFDGGSKTVTTQSNSSPWAGQQPFLTDVFKQAQTLSQTPQQYFPGSTVVPFSQQTQQALGLQEQRALAGSPLLRQTQANTQAALSGQLSPAVSNMIQQVGQQIRPGLDAQFSGAGRYGSGAHQAALASALTNAGTQLAYQDFNNAMQSAPQLAMQDYADIGQLANVGALREQQAGAQLQDQINRFNFQQQEPAQRLGQYAALVGGGSYGGSNTSQQPIYSNPGMQLAGLGLAGLGTYGSLFGQKGAFPGGNGFFDLFGG